MEKYTIEDIEVIRKKSGISYQEAVALLDYHNGNLAQALIDLERNDRLSGEGENETSRPLAGAAGSGFSGLLTRLYRTRLKIHRNHTTPIANISLLYLIVAGIMAPYLVVGSAVAALLLGYGFSFDKNDKAFASENFGKLVRNAGENAKNTVNDVVRTFSGENKSAPKSAPVSEKEESVTADVVTPAEEAPVAAPVFTEESMDRDIPVLDVEATSRETVIDVTADLPRQPKAPAADPSCFVSNPATAKPTVFSAAPNVPTIQVPVQVDFREGNVTLDKHEDGSSSVTIG